MASKDKAQKEDRKKSKMTIKEKRKAKDEKKKSGSTNVTKQFPKTVLVLQGCF